MKKYRDLATALAVIASLFAASCQKDATATIAPALQAATSALTEGWTADELKFSMQTPWDLKDEDRYSYDKKTNTYTFFIYKNDASHAIISNTGPRSEMRFLNGYVAGKHQFEADILVAPGAERTCLMQVYGGTKSNTSFMAFVDKGSDGNGVVTRYYGPDVIEDFAYNKWWHLNVIHDVEAGKIYVYCNEKLTGTYNDGGKAFYYFKCGVYSLVSDSAKAQFRNIRLWSKPPSEL